MENSNGMNRWYKRGEELLSEIAASRPRAGEAYIWFAGQHGFIIALDGKVLYIDVILGGLPDKDGKSRRVYPPPFAPGKIQKVDFALCTHDHSDHLDTDTLAPLSEANPETRFIVPAPSARKLVDAGIAGERVIAAKAGESVSLSGLTIVPVAAVHTRYIRDDGEKDENGDYTSLGFIIKGDGISLYHSGDTWVTPSLVETLKTNAPLDIAMLPINGSDWERTGEGCIGNMGCLDAVKLARKVPFDVVIPSHYDMMANNSENPARFADAMYSLCPEKRFHICVPGERFIYKKG